VSHLTEDGVRRAIAAGQLIANASMQRELAASMRDCIGYARRAGLSWRDIGRLLGMDHCSVFRQMQAGSPVSVVRAFQTPNRSSGALSPEDGA
jgi:hypothetical protein